MMSFLKRNYSHGLIFKNFIGKTRMLAYLERTKNVDLKKKNTEKCIKEP